MSISRLIPTAIGISGLLASFIFGFAGDGQTGGATAVSTKTIAVTKAKAETDTWEAAKLASAKYEGGTFSFSANEASGKNMCRLVHDKRRVVALFISSGVTSSIYDIVEGTPDECVKAIKDLGLADERSDPEKAQFEKEVKNYLEAGK